MTTTLLTEKWKAIDDGLKQLLAALDGKVTNIITDNASNMIKAFRLPGFGVEHENEESDSDDDDVKDDENEILAANLSECMVYLPQHDSCFARTIQLVVKDGFKNAKAINKVLAKAASIVSYVRKSVNASEILEGERRLQAKVATRWNSELKRIRSLMRVPVEKPHLDCQQLNSYDRLILNDLIEILTPFEEATDATQGQNIVTGSFIIPCIRGLRASLTLRYQSSMICWLPSMKE